MTTIRLNDEGTTLRGTVYNETGGVEDISSATTKNFIFRKPDGSILTKAGSFATDGSNGVLTYIFVAGDLNTSGRWEVEIQVILASGKWLTNIGEFYVD